MEIEELEKKKWKKEKLDAIREYHKDLITDLGISVFDFNMKKAFIDNGIRTVRIFDNEFLKEKGFFFELIDSNLDPVDPERKVYRLAPNPNYEEEYELTPKNQYIVPLEELRVVNPASVAISKSSAVTSSDHILKEKIKFPSEKVTNVVNNERFAVPLEKKDNDAPYSEMTIRDYMAIHTGKPVSLKSWLNDLIKSSK